VTNNKFIELLNWLFHDPKKLANTTRDTSKNFQAKAIELKPTMPEVEQPKSIFQLIPRVVALVVTSMLMESEYMDDKPASTTGVVWKDFLKSIRPLDLDLLEKNTPSY